MNKNKIPGLLLAIIGLSLTIMILYGALKFYHNIKELSQNNPSLQQPHNLPKLTENDTLVDYIASLNQQLAAQLNEKPDAEKSNKLMRLHECITYFIIYMDSLENSSQNRDALLLKIKNSVNKTNSVSRDALFDPADTATISGLKEFYIQDEIKPSDSLFGCLQEKEISKQCFMKIKHEALYLESIILEKNFKKLNL
jgi:uncharacterized protein YxeA